MEPLELAIKYHEAGFSVVPVSLDGRKIPLEKWGELRNEGGTQTPNDVKRWFGSRVCGVGLLTGPCSGNLEAIDIDDPERVDAFLESIPAMLKDRLCRIRSPRDGGGLHVVYLTTTPDKWKGVLAKTRTGKLDDHDKPIYRVAAETTSYIVALGSDTRVHKTGEPYRHVGGPDILELETITDEERATLFEAARALDERDAAITVTRRSLAEKRRVVRSVGDDFLRRATWESILSETGARVERVDGNTTHWTRPGKDSGTSAVTGGELSAWGNDVLTVFSSNFYPFEAYDEATGQGVYNKLAAFVLIHYGDLSDESFAKAIPKLAAAGYGPDPITDLGIAERAAIANEERLLYVDKWKRFVRWDGSRYADGTDADIHSFLTAVIRRLPAERPGDDDVAKLAVKYESWSKLRGVVSIFKRTDDVQASPDEFNQKPYVFNCQNGSVDLLTGDFRKARREDRLTQVAPFKFDAKATCPKFEAFLGRIMEGDAALIAYLRRLAGYCLTGDVCEHTLPIFIGDGRNGKGTFIRILEAMFGVEDGYAGKLNKDVILRSRLSSLHPTELTALYGKRLVAIEETADGSKLDEATVKNLTGGDRIHARYISGNPWSFLPTHQIILATNHRPELQGTDRGIWSRVRMIPFDHTFENPDASVEQELHREIPGIFNWALAGCLEWQLFGDLGEPERVLVATSEYRSDMDIVGQWIASKCKLTQDDEDFEELDALYSSYEDYCYSWQAQPMTKRNFGFDLKRRGVDPQKRNSKRYRHGIKLTS